MKFLVDVFDDLSDDELGELRKYLSGISDMGISDIEEHGDGCCCSNCPCGMDHRTREERTAAKQETAPDPARPVLEQERPPARHAVLRGHDGSSRTAGR